MGERVWGKFKRLSVEHSTNSLDVSEIILGLYKVRHIMAYQMRNLFMKTCYLYLRQK